MAEGAHHPRDLWAPIAGTGREGKVNSALDGGQDRLVATVESALGVQVDHYVQVDFKAFRGVVDALGGVDIPFRAPARDAVTGLSVKKAGCVHLNGESALQYVRSRQYEEFFRGGWHLDGRQDLGRIERQQGFMRHVAAQADLPSNVTRINKLISSVVTNLTVDSGFDVDDMTDLALAFRGKGANALQPLELPVKIGRAHGQSVVFLDKGADDAIRQLLDGITPLSPAPAPSPSTPAAPAPAATPTTAASAC